MRHRRRPQYSKQVRERGKPEFDPAMTPGRAIWVSAPL